MKQQGATALCNRIVSIMIGPGEWLCENVHAAFRVVVPRPEDRVPLNWETWLHLLSPMPLILVMSYFARRPNTYLMRLMFLPILIFTSLRAGFCYIWLNPRFSTYNFGGGVFALSVIAKALEYALTPEGIKKIDEKVPGQSKVPAIAKGSTHSNEAPDPSLACRPFNSVIPTPLSDAVELLCSMRGIGFEYGHGVFIPPEDRPLEKGPFLRATFRQFLISFLTVDILDSLIKLTPPLKSVSGGSIFMDSLPRQNRYLLSTAIHVATGCAISAGFEMVYTFITLVAVAVLAHSPTAWPPVFNKPWSARSLNEFWACRWHQALRRTFIIYGGFLGKWAAHSLGLRRDLGMLFGVFIASGLYHEFSAYAMGKGLDWRPPAFFLMHAFFILGERQFRRITGHRVGGLAGRLWVYFSIIILGQSMIDSWYRRGLGFGLIIPPVISPTRRVCFPLIRHLLKYMQEHQFGRGVQLQYLIQLLS